MRIRAVLALSAFLGALVVLVAPGVAVAQPPTPTPAETGPAATAPAAPGGATPTAAETLRGVVRDEQEPLEGVEIIVTQQGGDEVDTVTTDDEGRWEVPLPGPGTYDVTLNAETLPEGVSLRDPERETLTVPVNPGQSRGVLFPLGEGTAGGATSRILWLQLFVDGIRFGLILALGAVGLSLIFGTTGLTNFAHGELVTLGALVAYFFNSLLGLRLILAAILSVIVCGALGWVQDRGLWSVLRRRGTGLIAMMIVSIGLAIFLRYLYLFIFGGSTRSYDQYITQQPIDLGPIGFPPRDLWSMGIAIVVLTLTALALLRTRIGKATRAVADNPSLAAASGIDVERVIRTVWVVGAALAALGGVLLGIAQQVNWQLGFQVLLLIFAAVTLGGLGTAFGALVGSLVVGVFIQMSTLLVAPELKNVGALLILILVLLVRPQGILGRRERIG